VVVRTHDVGIDLPWQHFVGSLPSDEQRPDFQPPDLGPSHPYRREEFYRLIPLSGTLSSLEVGTAIAAICLDLGVVWADDDRCELITDREAILRRLCDGAPCVPGGIVVEQDGRRVIEPQCCARLGLWRELIRFAEGGPSPWCGHSPDPHLVKCADGMLAIGHDSKSALRVAPAVLSDALRAVELDLDGFADAVARWAIQVCPSLAQRLVATLRRDLALP
jgi:hypothetical protein